jgi:hypothetical protein
MNDKKLLLLTNIRLDKSSKSADKKRLAATSYDDNSKYLFTSGLEMLSSSQIEQSQSMSLPLLPSKRIPKHIFSKKKEGVPKRKLYQIPAWEIKDTNEISKGNKNVDDKYQRPMNVNDMQKARLESLTSLPKSSKHAPARLEALQHQLQVEQDLVISHEKQVLRETLKNAERMVIKLPLQYLNSKANLRHYALERACKLLMIPAKYKLQQIYIYVIRKWKDFDKHATGEMELMNEMQVGFIVISKILCDLLIKHIRYFFKQWAFKCVSKYDAIRNKKYNNAAYLIQHWYKQMRVIKKQPFRDFISTIQMCLHRRRAIKYTLQYEHKRRKALNKMRKGIATRRRYHFAARAIQRIYRWVMLLRWTRYRLTRSIHARKVQRWRRKIIKREPKDLLLIGVGLRAGGYTKIKSRIPNRYREPRSLLESIERVISGIQKWYLSRLGKMDLYLKLAKRRQKMELEAKRNKCATKIQRGYRRHLFFEMIRAMLLNNRCRRIQRAFRSYHYRLWMYWSNYRRKQWNAKIITKYISNIAWKNILYRKFNKRKLLLRCMTLRKFYSARKIQLNYREHVIYAFKRKAELLLFFAQQRLKGDVVIKAIETIQRNWRQFHNPTLFAKHIRLWAQKESFKEKLFIWKKARIIQKCARGYILLQRQKYYELQILAVSKIRRCGRAYILRVSLHRRVLETIRKRDAATHKIQYNYRMFSWLKVIKQRFQIMKEKIELDRLRNRCATKIQLFIRRQFRLYYMPLRVAARRQLKKKRDMAIVNALLKLKMKSVKTIQKMFRMNVKWCKFLRKMQMLRRSILEDR